MRQFTVVLVFLMAHSLCAQNLHGAWEATMDNEGKMLRNVVIITDAHQVATFYEAKTGAFVSTNGGTWSLNGTMLQETVEFDSENPERVGTTSSFEIEVSKDELRIKDSPLVWKRVDDGSIGKLYGAWLMSGRKRNGQFQTRDTNRPRKTMKIVSGSRFQWIAYNTETKEFMATGGGTYTTVDGKYTENIEFFSRDDSRVGASLEFDFELKDGDWHHSGFSSKGAPLYEVWSLRQN